VAGKMVFEVETNAVKRVATLYRVSTKKQLDLVTAHNDSDIPSQQKACKSFIESKPGWRLVEEYCESGVSGFKKRAEDRDEIQRAKKDALKGHFDVLLVFMFDRLGRIDDETPFVLEWFVKTGVEMWSVTEGQQKIDGHMDKLMNYLRFWQASGESVKTSIRVNEKHSQMVEAGEYRGGTVPFGYKTVKSGKTNKKGKELLKVIIDPEKAIILNWIYDLVDLEGYGQYRLAKQLNEKNVLTNTGRSWSSSSVNVLLRNPMYKGYMVYARGTEKEIFSKEQIQELIIIDEAKWERVQALREKRSPGNTKIEEGQSIIRATKGSLILVGLIKCGHCGSPLTTTWNKKSYVLKDGTKNVYRSAKYRCSGKAHQKVKCSGKTVHSPIRIEGVVLDELYGYLDQLKTVDLTSQIESIKSRNLDGEVGMLRKLQKELDKANSELASLKGEVIKVIMGQSPLDRAMLSGLIKDKENEVLDLQLKTKKVQQELDSKKVEYAEMEALQKYIPVWREVFEQASSEKKKMMLSTIIGGVVVYRDRIEVYFKLHISQFINGMGYEAIKHKNSNMGKVLSYSSLAANA
jgi:site-specific DNA recombinase